MSIPRKIQCTVAAIADHGGRVYTVDLLPAIPVPAFHPGQFLHLTVDEYDPGSFWPESRVFSIASSARERNRLRICYAVKGRYTTRMEQALKVGGEVWVKLPYGDFVIDGSADAVLIAGGTGISAFTAFLEALSPDTRNRIKLVYGARTPALLLFQEMLLDQLARVSAFDLFLFTEKPEAEFSQRMANLPRTPRVFTGRIDLDAVWPQMDSPAGNLFYLSGPPVMLTALGADLQGRGVAVERIRTDAWE